MMHRRPLRAAAALLALAAAAGAQDMEDRFKEKLAKDFVKNAEWVLDYDEAQKKAKETKKPIFAYFTRSYSP
jgi:ribosomal protein S17E